MPLARCSRRLSFALVVAGLPAPGALAQDAVPARPPNVILILTDDQGYGDLGAHGNGVIRTPYLDQLAGDSVELTGFHVEPVCAPTRASVLTGRNYYRTGVTDTWIGRALMDPAEVTLAELLGAAGYATGAFGKWHLGDNAPRRPMEQGFQESLVHRGGGLGQPADVPGGGSYFDPTLVHNGVLTETRGYCSDVYTDAALEFVEAHQDEPFFLYLAFNAPHTPLEVAEDLVEPYRAMTREDFPDQGYPLPESLPLEQIARVYAMVENLDANVGRLLHALADWKLEEDTVVVFLTDNGPQQPRYNGGLRGRKGSVFQGGIQVPCYVRWPGRLEAGRKVGEPAAHVDLVPTLLEACGVAVPDGLQLDGTSLLPLLQGQVESLPQRTLHFQWHRGDAPEPYRAFASRRGRYKLVQPDGVGEGPFEGEHPFLLFDLEEDPYEQHDLAAERPDLVESLRQDYDLWFADVTGGRGFAPQRIHLASPAEPEAWFTRQDWRGPDAPWRADALGHWEVDVVQSTLVTVRADFRPKDYPEELVLKLGGVVLRQPVEAGRTTATFERVPVARGPARLELILQSDQGDRGVWQAAVLLNEDGR